MFRSGLPFGISSGRDNSFSGIGPDRADLFGQPGPARRPPEGGRLVRYFDPQPLTFNAPGTFGNSPRNFLRGMSVFNIDASLQKSFPISERLKLMLRGEFFNLLNHANFGLPGSSVASPNTLGSSTEPRSTDTATRGSAELLSGWFGGTIGIGRFANKMDFSSVSRLGSPHPAAGRGHDCRSSGRVHFRTDRRP